MNLQITIDQHTISLVFDQRTNRVIGTAFAFIQPNWVVTAKHVILESGIVRGDLAVLPHKRSRIAARKLYVHPQVDLAVLELENGSCARPLFPAHHSLAGSRGLICAGYAPSRSSSGDPSEMFINNIPLFTVESRERELLTEELIVFDAPFAEGGHSGGPIFGSGGGVVGVIIEQFREGDLVKARGTSLLPIVQQLGFRND